MFPHSLFHRNRSNLSSIKECPYLLFDHVTRCPLLPKSIRLHSLTGSLKFCIKLTSLSFPPIFSQGYKISLKSSKHNQDRENKLANLLRVSMYSAFDSFSGVHRFLYISSSFSFQHIQLHQCDVYSKTLHPPSSPNPTLGLSPRSPFMFCQLENNFQNLIYDSFLTFDLVLTWSRKEKQA